jgi:hypothetical protein
LRGVRCAAPNPHTEACDVRLPVPADVNKIRTHLLAAVLAGTAWPVAAQERPVCPAPGKRIQWIADYCMLRMETDDEIAVSGCIEAEMQRKFATACQAKLHFKAAMCRTLVGNGTRPGTVQACTQDRTFMGRTVEQGGAGS